MSCSLSHSIGNFYARRHAILPEDLDDAVLLRIQVLPGLSSAHRAQALPPQTVITNVPFDVPVYSFDEYENPVETGTDVFLMKMTGGYHGRLEQKPMVDYLENNTYMVQNLFVVSRDLFQLHIDLMSLRHNNSLSQCPELSPVPGGEIYQLSEQRAIGSRATLRCYSGFAQAGGEEELLCEWPQPSAATSQGTWLAPDGTKQIPAACMPLQNFCPPLDLNSSFIWAASHGRDPGSVVKLRCQVGLIPSAGDSTLVCGSDGIWRKPIYTLPQPLSEVLSCAPHPNFCSDPSPLLLEGAIAHMSEMHLNATVLVTCAVGYEPSGGEDMGLCGIHPEDDSRGRWVSPSSISKGQVPWKPLRCRLKQSYCPTIQMSHGMLLSLSKAGFRLHPSLVCI
eukprot:g28568.t1